MGVIVQRAARIATWVTLVGTQVQEFPVAWGTVVHVFTLLRQMVGECAMIVPVVDFVVAYRAVVAALTFDQDMLVMFLLVAAAQVRRPMELVLVFYVLVVVLTDLQDLVVAVVGIGLYALDR